MKVIISGPRRLPRRDDPRDPWPHMHIELDLPELPAEGEHIIVNDGSSYTVRRRMWWVDTPQNEAYWSWDGDYDTDQGIYKIAYLDVLPSDYDEPFTADKMLAEGAERGHEQAAAEVENLLNLTAAPGVDPASALAMLQEWCRGGAAKTRERAEQAARHRALAERILAELAAEREQEAGNA